MKRIKMGIIALAAITGIGGAFAFSNPHKALGTTYYGYRDTNGDVKWKTDMPSGACSTTSDFACTITSTSANVTSLVNQFPDQYSILGGEGTVHSRP